MKSIFLLLTLLILSVFLSNCGSTPEAPTAPKVSCEANGDTPTAAFKRLFDAVKSKNTEAIKAELSVKTLALGEMMAERYKKSLESAYENGLTETTMSPGMPEMRDERVNCNMGALEVWNAKSQRWEDLAFVIENGKWKLASGDAFGGTFRSPGKGMALREAEAANAARGNAPLVTSNTNVNKLPVAADKANSNSVQKRTGAQ